MLLSFLQPGCTSQRGQTGCTSEIISLEVVSVCSTALPDRTLNSTTTVLYVHQWRDLLHPGEGQENVRDKISIRTVESDLRPTLVGLYTLYRIELKTIPVCSGVTRVFRARGQKQ